MNVPSDASRSPGLGSSPRPGNDVGRRPGARCSQGAAASRRSPASTRAAFPCAIAAEVKELRRRRCSGRSQAAQVRQPLASLRAGRGRAGDARCRDSPYRSDRAGAGAARSGTGMMGMEFADLVAPAPPQRAPDGELDAHRLLDDEVRARPDGVLPQPGARGRCRCCCDATASAAMPPRSTPPAPPADRRSAPAMKLIRRGTADCVLAGGFDSMITPIGPGRVLPAQRGFAGQRHARARQPPVRRHAQRFRARRGRRVPGARGVGVGAAARRAHLRGARGRRQFAQQLPHHRFASDRAMGRSRRCSRRLADAGASLDARRLRECARHVDADERPQRVRSRATRCSGT